MSEICPPCAVEPAAPSLTYRAPVMYLHTQPSYARLCAPWPLPCDATYNPAISLYVHSLCRPLRKRLQRTLPQPLGP